MHELFKCQAAIASNREFRTELVSSIIRKINENWKIK